MPRGGAVLFENEKACWFQHHQTKSLKTVLGTTEVFKRTGLLGLGTGSFSQENVYRSRTAIHWCRAAGLYRLGKGAPEEI